MLLPVLMNLDFAATGAPAPPVVIPKVRAQSYAAIYRRTSWALIPFLALLELLRKSYGR